MNAHLEMEGIIIIGILTKKLFKTYDNFWNLKLSDKLIKEKKEINVKRNKEINK